ncbi:hypothetical protein CKO28_25670 [Rhodovibrio sodomensis]|uniref:Phage tail protein n=1 Tax=Rhodovibrio sodomensis TaxID=1088 RepID=A0ABS1DLP0_9PROT|nr:phage tail protein [Rhodovibrio sodomensis]MBK1671394.1 hypothetical protein [Rhodovibrio sodomensis]
MSANTPLLNFRFKVEWAGSRAGFSRVEGLNAETDVVSYREGNDPNPTPQRIPTLIRYGDVTLTRGILLGDNAFYEFYHDVERLRTERMDIVIKLLDESFAAVMQWHLRNAFARRLEGPVLSGTGEEGGLAIERLTLAHEGLQVDTSG